MRGRRLAAPYLSKSYVIGLIQQSNLFFECNTSLRCHFSATQHPDKTAEIDRYCVDGERTVYWAKHGTGFTTPKSSYLPGQAVLHVF